MTYDKNTIEFEPFPSSRKFIDLTDNEYGRWTVMGYAGRDINGHFWYCECACGVIKKIRSGRLKAGSSGSCGCLRRELAATRLITHGQSRLTKTNGPSPEFQAYIAARTRCRNPNHPAFKNYGGRGIEFQFESFEEFYRELGERPTPHHSVDRYPNNDGHYEPGNVRWATRREQALNTRRRRVH